MKRTIKWLDKNFECLILTIILAMMTIFMAAQVFARKVLGVTIPWTEPLCCHLMIYMGLWAFPARWPRATPSVLTLSLRSSAKRYA